MQEGKLGIFNTRNKQIVELDKEALKHKTELEKERTISFTLEAK